MIKQSIPVVLQLKHNGSDALCIGRLVSEAGRVFATPVRPPHHKQPYRPKKILLNEQNLELVQGERLYEYHGYVLVP